MITVYLERLKALRDIGFPLAAKRKKQRRLNFDRHMSPKGRSGCLLGWWATTEYAKRDGWTIVESHYIFARGDRIPSYNNKQGPWAVGEYFGLGGEDTCCIFGDRHYGSLGDRLDYLNQVITDMETQV